MVGIDYYDSISPLSGCVNDAHAVKAMLDRHADGSVNFHVKLMAGTGRQNLISKKDLKEAVRELFAGKGDVALLYFAGHGYIEVTGGYLCAGDCQTGDDGLPLGEIMTLASKSKVQNRIIVLDSCHSGIAGDHPTNPNTAELTEGMTVLAASTTEQYASEESGSGTFTSLFVDALGGAAANLVGEVTPGGAYAHVDQSLGSWAQRPVFKTNVERFVVLRRVQPPIDLADLRRIAEFFPEPGFEFQLDPSYEPERSETPDPSIPPPDATNTAVFAILQAYARVNLVTPKGAPHMWHAAMQSKSATLTAMGEHYRRLAAKGML